MSYYALAKMLNKSVAEIKDMTVNEFRGWWTFLAELDRKAIKPRGR